MTKDYLKREDMNDYTTFDLNAKCVRLHNQQNWEKMCKRKARRKLKAQLRQVCGIEGRERE